MYLVVFRGSYLLGEVTITTEYDVYYSAKNDHEAIRKVYEALKRWTTYNSARIINWSADGITPDRLVATL